MQRNVIRKSDIAYCTIVTKSHLAHARALADSLATHDPQSRIFALLADRIDGYFDAGKESFELITLEELKDQEDIQRMCFYYSPPELCFSLRAWLHEYMMEKTTVSKWIYLDADIVVYHSLQRISDQLDNTSILLSPHLLSINPPSSVNVKSIRKLESYLLRNGGIYNGGFLGLRRTEESQAFVRWFKDHLRFYGFDNRPMQSGDQFWLTYIPLYFREVSVLRNPGANLAFWNLYERMIEKDDSGKILVDGEPLLFFHFAGFDMNDPAKLTKYAIPRGLNAVPDPIKDLASDYHELLIAKDYEKVKNFPYAFAKFKNGTPITPLMRRFYFNEVFHGKACNGSPFEQPAFFQSRLRSRKTRDFLRKTGRYILTQIRRRLNRDYDFEIP
ncbi:MAG: glycosyl transferase, group 1 [Nitrospirota bacterium]